MNTKVTPVILGTSVLIISIVLFYFLFSSNNDLDNDGVVDDNDQCPKFFGTIENQGCPDKNNSNSVDLKSFEAEDLNFEKRIDLLMNGTMICTEHKLLITGEHANSLIVGRKLKYSKDKWYWDGSDENSPANTGIKFDQHLFTIYAKEVRAIDEREAVLNEKSIAGDNEDSGIRGVSSLDDYGKLIFIDDCYILVAGAFKYELDCKTWVKKQHSTGVNNAGYLWIPDYPSLSGRPNYATFLGPFFSGQDCAESLKKYPKNKKFYYCKEVSMSNGSLNPDDGEIRIR